MPLQSTTTCRIAELVEREFAVFSFACAGQTSSQTPTVLGDSLVHQLRAGGVPPLRQPAASALLWRRIYHRNQAENRRVPGRMWPLIFAFYKHTLPSFSWCICPDLGRCQNDKSPCSDDHRETDAKEASIIQTVCSSKITMCNLHSECNDFHNSACVRVPRPILSPIRHWPDCRTCNNPHICSISALYRSDNRT